MEYAPHYRYPLRRPAPPLTFRPWLLIGAVGFLIFALIYVSVGIRWHTYRARANLYAREEMELTFRAADYKRASRSLGLTEDEVIRAREFRRVADMCTKAAEERAQLRKLYEEAW